MDALIAIILYQSCRYHEAHDLDSTSENVYIDDEHFGIIPMVFFLAFNVIGFFILFIPFMIIQSKKCHEKKVFHHKKKHLFLRLIAGLCACAAVIIFLVSEDVCLESFIFIPIAIIFDFLVSIPFVIFGVFLACCLMCDIIDMGEMMGVELDCGDCGCPDCGCPDCGCPDCGFL